jgi:hypothetical protein
MTHGRDLTKNRTLVLDALTRAGGPARRIAYDQAAGVQAMT